MLYPCNTCCPDTPTILYLLCAAYYVLYIIGVLYTMGIYILYIVYYIYIILHPAYYIPYAVSYTSHIICYTWYTKYYMLYTLSYGHAGYVRHPHTLYTIRLTLCEPSHTYRTIYYKPYAEYYLHILSLHTIYYTLYIIYYILY